MTGRRRDLVARTAVAAMLLATALAAAAPEPRPLTNEDVVRMVMRGVHEADVLEAIAARPPLFDLSPEVVEELRNAGVSGRVIEAMRRRQVASGRAETPSAPAPAASAGPAAVEEAAGPRGTLAIAFEKPVDPRQPSETTAIALKSLPRGTERMPGEEVGLMSDMALAVLCRTADHVPDNWDARTPLIGATRHELLLFRPGSGVEKKRGFELLYLEHADRYDVTLAEGSHRIVVAAAGRETGPGTWRILASDEARVDVVAGRTTLLTVRAGSRLRGSAMTGYAVDSQWKVVEARGDGAEAPAATAATAPGPPT
jgi:hypothetical protein